MQRLLLLVLTAAVLVCRGHPVAAQDPPELPAAPEALPPPARDGLEAELETSRCALANLGNQLAQAADENEVAKLRKQIELQQKQLEVLEKMIRLLADRVGKEPPGVTATLEARAEQAGRRDRELADAVDTQREQFDAAARAGPVLPPTLRELFLPSRTNESPLAIYGTLAADYVDFQDRPSNIPSPVFSPHFYMLLEERFLLEVNPEFRDTQVDLESAQLDWFVGDHLTLVLGRFYSPLGFFNERLHTSWIFKTPDRPLLFSQVFPSPLSFNGVQARGAVYLWELPVKLEYSTFVANGFSLNEQNPGPKDFADLREMSDTFNDVNQGKAIGGRLGLSIPSAGLIVGLSGYDNGTYDRRGEHSLSSWLVDASWHHGNWDVRFELAHTNQQAPTGPIHRRGFYAQVAYRPYDCEHPLLRRLEGVVRFDHVEFDGINLAATGLDFGGRERIPIDRNRWTVGLNVYAYPSLIFKVAYEINDELQFHERDDNGFLAQVTWGF